MACGVWSVIAIPLIENGGIILRPFTVVLNVSHTFGNQVTKLPFLEVTVELFSQELIIQIIGVIAIMIWSFLTSTFLFGSLHIFELFRSTEKEEIIGT